MRKCEIEGCGRGGKIRRGMCEMHYRRWRKGGDMAPRRIAPTPRMLKDTDKPVAYTEQTYLCRECGSHAEHRHWPWCTVVAGRVEQDAAGRFIAPSVRYDECIGHAAGWR